jgi:hypothetical protein
MAIGSFAGFRSSPLRPCPLGRDEVDRRLLVEIGGKPLLALPPILDRVAHWQQWYDSQKRLASGRDQVRALLGAVVATFEDFRYIREFRDGPLTALVFEAPVGDRAVQGVDLLEDDDHGQIKTLTVMVRPLSGLTALGDAVRARLAGG